MAIKSDRWIREMATEHGMIDPFEEGQVREGVISYGLSSYGYDMRVADEFRIFHNALAPVVDPKAFDERSFVEYRGAECIIPPNSFALARSVEYFRIPRDVMTITVGKSTYARCFSGDTRVALVDGTSPTLEEMARRSDEGELFWGYSVGRHGRIIVTLLDAPRHIGQDQLLEIELDDGQTIRCTPDHEFVRRDGRLDRAADLRPDDSLMPLYRKVARGYEMVYQPINGHIYPTHRLADEWNVRNGLYPDEDGTHRHRRDHDRRNNMPWNLERMLATEHIRLHNAETYGEGFDAEEHGAAIASALERRSQDPEWAQRFSEAQRRRARTFWNDDRCEEARAALRVEHRESWTAERRAREAAAMRRYRAEPAHREEQARRSKAAWREASKERRERQRELTRRLRLREEITADVVRSALDAAGSIRGAARLLECDRSVFRRFPEVIEAFRGTRAREDNHSISSIREVPGDHDVFCLTVPEAGNFALASGVFVRNCGIITNVTPFEPEWEGYVTLEISNTTPLPAKVYADEGIAQVLFLQADEACEVSYADRKGKYQGQTGVTTPKL